MFAKGLDQDQVRQNVGPEMDSYPLTRIDLVFLKDFFEKVKFEKSQQVITETWKIT